LKITYELTQQSGRVRRAITEIRTPPGAGFVSRLRREMLGR
jgi:hypothetical protein